MRGRKYDVDYTLLRQKDTVEMLIRVRRENISGWMRRPPLLGSSLRMKNRHKYQILYWVGGAVVIYSTAYFPVRWPSPAASIGYTNRQKGLKAHFPTHRLCEPITIPALLIPRGFGADLPSLSDRSWCNIGIASAHLRFGAVAGCDSALRIRSRFGCFYLMW